MNTALLIAALLVMVLLLSPGPPAARLEGLRDEQPGPGRSRLAAMTGVLPRQRKAERARSKRRAIEVATGLASAVEAGLAPRTALGDVTQDVLLDARSDQRVLASATAAAHNGHDVAGAFLADDRAHWRALGVAWRVGEESGAAFAPILDRVADSLRMQEKVGREAAIQLATARSTSRLLSVLPVAGILLGKSIGGDPVAFLVGTHVGWGCLVIGIILEVTGLLWTRRLLARASGD